MTPRGKAPNDGWRWLGVAALAAILVGVLVACSGHWFTPPQLGRLIVGPPVPKGGRYEVLISVADIPNGGLAGIQLGTVVLPAIAFHNVDASTIVAKGLSGFRVAAQGYSAGGGYLIAVYDGVAIESGQLLRLSFEATGNPTVTVDENLVMLASAVPAWIAGWELADDVAYYTKEAGGR